MVELSVAPMMEWTTRHQRVMARVLAPNTVLYTEMVVDKTLTYNEDKLERWLGFSTEEHPVVLQLGGNSVETLTRAAVLGEQAGFDEINLNCGCPSQTVANKNEFGARLMLKPELVGRAVQSMKRAVNIPVTVKCRLGVDDQDSYEFVKDFVEKVPDCDHFIIHARKAMLSGLSTTQNRSVPPLMYDRVYRLCEEFPDKKFTLNGGLTTVAQSLRVVEAQPKLHGLMYGRAAYHTPCLLPNLEYAVLGKRDCLGLSRRDVIDAYMKYCERQLDVGVKKQDLVKPLAFLFSGEPNGRSFRTKIAEGARKNAALDECIELALSDIQEESLDRPIVDESTDWSLDECVQKSTVLAMAAERAAEREAQEESGCCT